MQELIKDQNIPRFPDKELGAFLDFHYERFNDLAKLHDYPDPLSAVYKRLDSKYIDEIALICALYAYGNAKLIVKNLENMPFFMLETESAPNDLSRFPYYRFQTRADTRSCFLAMLYAIKERGGIKNIFMESFNKNNETLEGICALIDFFYNFMEKYDMITNGALFLFGNPRSKLGSLKRYNMFLRWMARKDNIDLGLWTQLPKSSLILPLDTHTFRISHKLGLCSIKSPNIKAAKEITANLLNFDSNDPIKYDFALYRIGQLNLIRP